MNYLKKSIEFIENVLEEKVQKCQEKGEHLDEQIREIYEWQLDPEYVHNKLVDLEDRSRRNNLRIDGIKEKVGESWEDCEAEVEKLFREKLDIRRGGGAAATGEAWASPHFWRLISIFYIKI